MLLATLPRPGPALSSALAAVAIGFGALTQCACWANIMDVAPNHAGLLLGITNTIGTVPGILCNVVTGYMLENGIGWAPVFALGAALELTGAAVYVSLASAEPQVW